jgi:predicted acyltransferase
MSSEEQAPTKPERVLSIDALRGFDMFWITGGKPVLVALIGLFVVEMPEWLNYQLSHPAWEGFSAWDMIMPLFLFIVGAAMPFSFSRRIEAGAEKRELYMRMARRVVALWVLGMIAQGNLLAFDSSTLQLFSNTLQAIAVGYLVAGIALIHLPILGQVILAVALLVVYWLLMILVPVPGHGAGIFEEHVNLAMYVDQIILRSFRADNTYTWILSGFGFAGMVLCGVFSGHLLRSKWSDYAKFWALVALGVGSLLLGWFWADGFEGMGMTLLGAWRFPIVKHLFTSSMVLWAAGWCYLLLALFYLLVDVLRIQRWAFFFIVIGANPIFAYMIIRFVNFRNIADRLAGGLAKWFTDLGSFGESFGNLLLAVTAYGALWLLLWYMYRNGTRIRV